MPGENLHKLTRGELRQLRRIVRKVYGEEQGLSREATEQVYTDRECDALIDSLMPETVEKLHERGIQSRFAAAKKFFLPTKIVNQNGKPFLKEDAG
jgi:hypothetical protein